MVRQSPTSRTTAPVEQAEPATTYNWHSLVQLAKALLDVAQVAVKIAELWQL